MKKVLIVLAFVAISTAACKKDELKGKDNYPFICYIYRAYKSTTWVPQKCYDMSVYTPSDLAGIYSVSTPIGPGDYSGWGAYDCSECAALAASGGR